MRGLILALAGCCLSACVTTPQRDYYGSGPLLSFHPEVQQAVSAYFTKQELDRALVITNDGQHGIVTGCQNSEGFYRCDGSMEIFAVTNCGRMFKKPCRLYAVDNRVVWKGAPQR